MQNEDQRLCESMKSLEIFIGQGILALQKTVVKTFEIIEETIKTDEHGVEVQGQDLALPIHVRVRDNLPRVLAIY